LSGRNYRRRRRLRVKVVIALCACLIGLTIIIAFSYTHFFVAAKDVQTNKSVSSQTGSAATNKTSVSASSTAAASSSVTQATQVSLQDAVTPLWIHVSIEDQTLTVYDADNSVVESWLCSTGSPGYDTPRGTFPIYNRGKSFFSQKYQEGGYYWVAFYEDYYIHSVPYDKNGNIIPTIANDLGHEDSHGCVHLAIPNSEWIYDNIPNGTKVVVD
jgi:lipoprotein-anchoring transpeptidase ErfK/SrfK